MIKRLPQKIIFSFFSKNILLFGFVRESCCFLVAALDRQKIILSISIPVCPIQPFWRLSFLSIEFLSRSLDFNLSIVLIKKKYILSLLYALFFNHSNSWNWKVALLKESIRCVFFYYRFTLYGLKLLERIYAHITSETCM